MSWIDDEFEAARRLAEKASTDEQRELHRAKLIDSKAIELWDALKLECQARVEEYVAKCGSGSECKVSLEDIPQAKRFIVRFEHVRRARAEVVLQLEGYKIEVKHITPTDNFPMESHASPWFFTFDCDGLRVELKSGGAIVGIPGAAQKILKPVLFPEK